MHRGVIAPFGVLAFVLGACSSPAPSERTAVEPVVNLDGTYLVDYDGSGTANGAPADNLISGKAGWVFRSWCDENGCVAAGGEIVDPNNPGAPLANPRAADYVDGRWIMVNRTENSAACEGPGGEKYRGDVWAIWDIAIAPDMTLAPTVTTIGTGDCPSVSVVTPTMTRAGDVLPEFPLPDPATQQPRRVPAAATFHGRYTVTRTLRGPQPGAPQVTDRTVATNCLRTGDRCVTTSVIPGQPGQVNSYLGVLEFADGRFVRKAVPLPALCADEQVGISSESETLPLPADTAQDPLPELTGELVETFTAVCPGRADYDIAYALRPT